MLKFILPDNTVVEGTTYEDIVTAMSRQKMTTPRSLASYRKAAARRIKSMMKPGTIVDTRTNEAFVRSLVKINCIEQLETERVSNA